MRREERLLLTPAERPARILVVALGSTGDVNPMLGIAAGLRRRGHDVVFLANPVFAPLAAKAALPFSPLGTAEDYDFIWDRRTWQWWRSTAWAFRHSWVPSLRPTYEVIASLASAGRAVLVANTVAPAAQLAREKLGLPLAVVSPSPLIFPSLEEFPDHGPFLRAPRWLGRPGRRLFYRLADALVDFWIAKGFNRLRGELGLPAARRFLTSFSRGDRVIGLWPEWFARPQEGWPSPLVLAGFLNYDRAELQTEESPPFPVAGEAEPPIVFTCGSAMTHAAAFLEVADGVQEILRRRAVLVTDRQLDSPAARSGRVQCVPYLPFRRILPRAAAVVHHGGIGTCAAALAAGIPQLIVPLAPEPIPVGHPGFDRLRARITASLLLIVFSAYDFVVAPGPAGSRSVSGRRSPYRNRLSDQFDNAERCERLGVARRVPRRRFRPRRVAGVLRDLLASPAVAECCRHWQARMDSGAALERACEAVETLAIPMRTDSTRE